MAKAKPTTIPSLFDDPVRNAIAFLKPEPTPVPYRPPPPTGDAEQYVLWKLGRARDDLRDELDAAESKDHRRELLQHLAWAEHAFGIQAEEVNRMVLP